MTDAINKTEPNNQEQENKDTTTVSLKKYQRRLIIVTGDKGGVGKSTFARGLVQTYIDGGVKFIGFDADSSNSQLLRFYGEQCNLEALDIFESGSIDIFFNDLRGKIFPKIVDGKQAQPEKLFVLELPPQSRRILQEFIERMEFLKILEEDYDTRVTMVVVISRISDSVKQLINLYEFCDNKVDYLVVKNLFFGKEQQFTRYDKSEEVKNIKATLKSQNLKFYDINMPDLIEHAYDHLDANDLTFRQGTEQIEYPAVKGRVSYWLKDFKEQLKPVKGILGLDEVEL